MALSADSILENTVFEHRILVILENGLTYTAKSGSVSSSWVQACKFILESKCKVHSLVPYKLEV